MLKWMALLLCAVAAAQTAGRRIEAPPRTFTNSIRMRFVWIDPGSFQMGSDDKWSRTPARTITLSEGYYLQTTDVTQAQWEAVMGTNPSHFKGPDRPVEKVSWDDVQEFLGKLNAREKDTRYRLPTEAEWEYACRAGGQEPDLAPNLDEVAWSPRNSGGQTHPVGQKKPNAWGLYDMRGNVEQWVSGWYEETAYYGRRIDPQGPGSGDARVVRGGPWCVGEECFRCAAREKSSPGYRSDGFGFRCARTF
jgi:formylglycine-generating enzyme required for sulfatase activity